MEYAYILQPNEYVKPEEWLKVQTKMPAKTTGERQESLRMRRALLGLAEVRGVYLPPSLHAELKAHAAKMLSKWQKRPQGAPDA